jgi:type IV fimbrial biogenesis protein FimT
MAELLAALAIIGILSAAASPVFVRMMRDDRVGSVSNQIAELYRVARSRALGRGTCVMVRFNAGHSGPTVDDPSGRFTIIEATVSLGGGTGGGAPALVPLPSSNCMGTDWTDDAETNIVAGFHDLAPQYEPALATVFTSDAAGNETQQTACEVVFSPRGRTFIRAGAATSFSVHLSTVRIAVQNTQTTFVRQVVVPPNGGARVVSRM